MDEGGVVKKVVLSFGMMVCDTLLRPVDRDVLSRDCTMIEKPVQACGGDALNTAIGLSRLGIPAVMAGRVGDDLNGRFILDQCRKLGIDVSHVVTDPVYATASSFALIEENGRGISCQMYRFLTRWMTGTCRRKPLRERIWSTLVLHAALAG